MVVSDSLLICRFCENPFISEAILKVHECFCVNNSTAQAQKKNVVDIEQMTVIFNGTRSYYCQYCLFRTGRSNIFSMHLKKHEREVNLYYCKICNTDLFNPYDLFNHFQLLHPGWDSYQCPRCSFTTTHVSLMRQHWKSHFYHRCGFCTYKTIDLMHLRLHRHKHLNRKFRCIFKECICSCDTSEALENHITEHHGLKSKSEEGCSSREPDKNYNTNNSDDKTVEEIISECNDSVAEGHSHVSHETSRTEVDGFSRSVELYDQVNSDISERVEEDKKDELSKPLISNYEIYSSVVSSLDAHTIEAVSPKKVKNSELLQNVVNGNARPSTSHDL